MWELNKISTKEDKITDIRIPTVRSSMQLELSIAEALAALRGWMLLDDKTYKDRRQQAWRNIEQEFETLKKLSKHWTTLESKVRLERISKDLVTFRQYQNEIEAIAQTKENIPSMLMLFNEAAPRATDMMKQITTMIDIEKGMAVSIARKKLLLSMADYRGSLGYSLAHIRAHLISGDSSFHQKFDESMDRNESSFKELLTQQPSFTVEQKKVFSQLKKVQAGFIPLTATMMTLRNQQDWNIANYWLKTRAAPIGLRLVTILQEMVEQQNNLMQKDGEAIQNNINQFKQILVALLLLTIISAIIIATLITRQIIKPIKEAVILAKHISESNFSTIENIDIRSGTKETKQLLTSLYTMAEKLDEMMHKLRSANEAQVKAIVDTAYDAIITINKQGTIELVNPATLRIFSYSQKDELVGKNISILMPKSVAMHHDNYLANHTSGKKSQVFISGVEVVGLKENGETMPVFLTVSELKAENGQVKYCGIIRDLTEEKNSQRQLIHADKLASLGTLATGIAHELRQPLFVMQGNAEEEIFDGLEGFNVKTAFSTLEQVVHNCTRMNGIINHLRTFAREGGEEGMTNIEFVSAIDSAFTLMAQQFKNRGIEVERNISDNLPLVTVDVNRIEQVIINILNNARDALEGCKMPKVTITIIQREGKLVCTIADNGPGISGEILTKIFDPFFTTKSIGEGTGLGMSISHGIISDYNGSITVCNGSKGGAEFTILLPAYTKPSSQVS